jgi:hypothetical protein
VGIDAEDGLRIVAQPCGDYMQRNAAHERQHELAACFMGARRGRPPGVIAGSRLLVARAGNYFYETL